MSDATSFVYSRVDFFQNIWGTGSFGYKGICVTYCSLCLHQLTPRRLHRNSHWTLNTPDSASVSDVSENITQSSLSYEDIQFTKPRPGTQP